MNIEKLESKLGMFSGNSSSQETLEKCISEIKKSEKSNAFSPDTKRVIYIDLIEQYLFDSELSLNQIIGLFDTDLNSNNLFSAICL
ncbi:MAG: hypothetical protein OXN27_05660 [Candidatus Poribacteria bacterium]|nr:hypothetical protein [Candidatus Poribacteria bacterium]